jgi:hypothetical protein
MKSQMLSDRNVNPIKLQLTDRSIVDGEIRFFARYQSEAYEGASRLELSSGAAGEFAAEAHNYFDALIRLRDELEPLGIKLLCFGARRDAWASGMQRDMGAGLKAYLLSSPDRTKLVQQSIFDYAPPETIGTTREQREFAEDWASKRGSRGESGI